MESLRKRQQFAGELLNDADLRAPTLSAHLRVLRQCGLVICRRRGTRLEYQLNSTALRLAHNWLATFKPDATKRSAT